MPDSAGMIAIGMRMLLYALHNVSQASWANATDGSEIPLFLVAILEIERDSGGDSQ
jgi:hypothetical protein